MGYYVGDYQSISKVWLNQDLSTRFIDETLGTNGIATPEQDLILPPVFIDYVNARVGGCPFSINRAKTIRLFSDTDKFLLVVIPWKEGSSDYHTFFEEVLSNPEIVRIDLLPEVIQDESLKWHVLLN